MATGQLRGLPPHSSPQMVNALPPDFVEAMEKQKEKERRAKLREENLKLQKAEQERRQIRSLERFNAPVPKWTKKPEMKRSFLPDKKTVRVSGGRRRGVRRRMRRLQGTHAP